MSENIMNADGAVETTPKEGKKAEIQPAKLNILVRGGLTLISCCFFYLLTATHFFGCVGAAHLLGDVSYLPPSVTRWTGVIFQNGEVEAGAQIIFFVVWLVAVTVSIAAVIFAALAAVELLLDYLTDDKSLKAAFEDCFSNGLICLSPMLIVSVLTLLIMPLESYHPAADSTSLTQLGEMMPFGEFLYTMTQATVVIFLVCFFVVITVGVAYLISELLPIFDGAFFTFFTFFVGVCVGIAVIMVLGHYSYLGMEILQHKTGSASLTHYAIFGIYTALCVIFIGPSTLKERDLKREKFEEYKQKKAQRLSKATSGKKRREDKETRRQGAEEMSQGKEGQGELISAEGGSLG